MRDENIILPKSKFILALRKTERKIYLKSYKIYSFVSSLTVTRTVYKLYYYFSFIGIYYFVLRIPVFIFLINHLFFIFQNEIIVELRETRIEIINSFIT